MRPRATYRLQFHHRFTFADASALVPYLAKLGVSHVYASPLLAARPGSMHGYDVIDHTRIDPELGGEDAFRSFCARLRSAGLKLIADIVPNHMAASAGNAWWLDVLEKGRGSAYAKYFDIDWNSNDPLINGKILAPFLGAPYIDELQRGNISLTFEEALQKLVFAYYGHRFPLRLQDYELFCIAGKADPARLAAANNPAELHRLLERQHFRLSWWRTAADSINWRRFFNINDLIGLNVDDLEVFEAVHAKILSLVAEGLIDGLRVDHVDGLADPRGYCRQLRTRLDRLARGTARPYLIVEKILAENEHLPGDWGVDGTTGYDFLNEASALLHDPAGEEPLARTWRAISGRERDFENEERAAREELVTIRFAASLSGTATAFHDVAMRTRSAVDLTLPSIRLALIRLVSEMRTYRTYATGLEPYSDPAFDAAVSAATKNVRGTTLLALQFIASVVTGGEYEGAKDAVRRFNQLAAPVAAKAVEDTAFYRYGLLLSRNDIGCSPQQFSLSPEGFHARAKSRGAQFPGNLLATATHDHKRGEDARVRLAILSEIPDTWRTEVRHWFALNAKLHDSALDAGDEYQLYQTLVGAWPAELVPPDAVALAQFAERIVRWRIKSLREAGLRSSWTDPDPAYEAASENFVHAILDFAQSRDFLTRLHNFIEQIAPAGVLNGIVQTTLRHTVPGIPDLYQGSEFWDFTLVDPDNRAQVDFTARASALRESGGIDALLRRWRNGRVKQRIIGTLLTLHAEQSALFERGVYVPLDVSGPRKDHILAFARTNGATAVLVAVPRLVSAPSIEAKRPMLQPSFWSGTRLELSRDLASRRWTSLFDAQFGSSGETAAACSALFANFPVAVLIARA